MADCPGVSAYPSLMGWSSRLYTVEKALFPCRELLSEKGKSHGNIPWKTVVLTQPTNSASSFYDQYCLMLPYIWGSVVKNVPVKQESQEIQVDPWVGRSPGEGNGNPLQCSCQDKPMDRGARWTAAYGVSKRRTGLSDWATFLLPYTPEMKLMNNTHIPKKISTLS